MVDETGKPDNCVHPEPERSRRRRPRAATRPSSTRSSTSTRCSTSATARPTTCRSTELEQGPEEGRDDAELLLHLAQPLQRRDQRPVPGRRARRRRPAPMPSSPTWVPKILASPAYKKDGLLIVTFGQVNPARARRPGRRRRRSATRSKVGALLVSRFVTPGATDAAAYDPYSLLRSTEDLFGLSHLGQRRRREGEVVRAGAAGRKRRRLAPARDGVSGRLRRMNATRDRAGSRSPRPGSRT